MDTEELKLARQRLRIETKLHRADQRIQRDQLAAGQLAHQGWRAMLTPTGAAVAAGIIAVCGTAASKWFDLRIESKKAETNVILKASEVPVDLNESSRVIQRARNLLWFAEAGYITLPTRFLTQLRQDAQLQVGETPSAPAVQPITQISASESQGFKNPKLDDAERQRLSQQFATMTFQAEMEPQITAAATKLKNQQPRYELVGKDLGVPWQVIAVLHELESGGSFATHLHNGQPLSARTTFPPSGRPVTGNPPFTWEESAKDAMKYFGADVYNDWSVPGTLYFCERFNGWGYRRRNIPSPYVWCGSQHYEKGKFVADGRFDPEARSKVIGVAPLLKKLGYSGDQP